MVSINQPPPPLSACILFSEFARSHRSKMYGIAFNCAHFVSICHVFVFVYLLLGRCTMIFTPLPAGAGRGAALQKSEAVQVDPWLTALVFSA